MDHQNNHCTITTTNYIYHIYLFYLKSRDLCNTFHPLLCNYTGCKYCTSYVILLPFNINPCTSCTLHSLHYLLCLQFTAPVYSHSSLYIFLIFLRLLCCCVELCFVVLYILCK